MYQYIGCRATAGKSNLMALMWTSTLAASEAILSPVQLALVESVMATSNK